MLRGIRAYLGRKIAGAPVETGERTGPKAAGGALSVLGDKTLTLSDCARMRTDPQIALALAVIKAPLFAADWWVESETENAAEFVEEQLKRLWLRLVRTSLAAVDFGFAPHEKVWEVEDGKYVLDAVKDLDPRKTDILSDAMGHFAGLRFKGGETVVDLPVEKCFVMTVGREFGNLCGTSRLAPAAKAWRRGVALYKATDRYYEKKADPPLKGRAPQGRFTDAAGGEKDNLEYMSDAMRAIRDGGAVVLPVGSGPDGSPAWDVDYLTDDKRGDMFLRYIEHIEMMKLRAVLVPDRLVTQGEKGAYSQAQVHADVFLRLEDYLLSELFEHLQRYIVTPLVEYNFGVDVEVMLLHRSLSDDTKELMRAVMEKLLAGVVGPTEVLAHLDVRRVLELSDLPLDEEEGERLSLANTPADRRREGVFDPDATRGSNVRGSGFSAASEPPARSLGPEGASAHTTSRRLRADSELRAADAAARRWAASAVDAYEHARERIIEEVAAGRELVMPELPHFSTLLSYAMFEADIAGRYFVARDGEARRVRRGAPSGLGLAAGEVDIAAAEEYLRGMKLVSESEIDRLREVYEAHAFSIAGVEEKALLAVVRDALAKAVTEGTSQEEFAAVIDEAFKRAGVSKLSPTHVETVFTMNVHSAYHAGRWAAYQAPGVKDIFPAFMYVTMQDERVREAHAAMDSMVFAADDPIWQTWWPPNGFNCRCTTVGVDRWEIEDGLYAIEDSADVSVQPDPGFAYNVGVEGMAKAADAAKGPAAKGEGRGDD